MTDAFRCRGKMVEKCASCGTKKGMRPCPGLGGRICPLCCGTKRRIEIRCPAICEILKASGDRTEKKPADGHAGIGDKRGSGGNGACSEHSEAWDSAELEYSALIAMSMMPMLGKPPSTKERKRALERILSACPEYYPAKLDLGFHLLCQGGKDGGEKEGRRMLLDGVRGLLASGEKSEISETIDNWCANLESRFRFEESIELHRAMLDAGVDTAGAHNGIGYCLALLGDFNGAARENQMAVEAEPGNAVYIADLAHAEMQRGNLEAAKESLERALRLDPKAPLAWGNMQCLKAMMRKGGAKDWKSYLLREPARRASGRPRDTGRSAAPEALAEEQNDNLLTAFRNDLARRTDIDSARKYDLKFSVKQFARIAARLPGEEPFFLSDAIRAGCDYKHVLDRLIIEISDVDRTVLDEMYAGVREFYGFLEREGVIGMDDIDGIIEDIDKARPGIADRMDRYNALRREPDLTPERKARERRRIFGAGIDWP
jgi:tetratricopeptide (TPR) repeat protein